MCVRESNRTLGRFRRGIIPDRPQVSDWLSTVSAGMGRKIRFSQSAVPARIFPEWHLAIPENGFAGMILGHSRGQRSGPAAQRCTLTNRILPRHTRTHTRTRTCARLAVCPKGVTRVARTRIAPHCFHADLVAPTIQGRALRDICWCLCECFSIRECSSEKRSNACELRRVRVYASSLKHVQGRRGARSG